VRYTITIVFARDINGDQKLAKSAQALELFAVFPVKKVKYLRKGITIAITHRPMIAHIVSFRFKTKFIHNENTF
jgi:hypothetical protein